jgi:ATP-dependent RNA helicase DeaD
VQVVVLTRPTDARQGFAEDIEAIFSTPDDRQTVCSRPRCRRIDRIIRRHLNDPARIQIGRA